MRRIRYQVACSLDGYIAGPNGEYDWIPVDPDIDFQALYDQFDTLVMGRRTFEDVPLDTPEFGGKRIVVVSGSLRPEDHPGVTVVSGDALASTLDALLCQPGKDIWLYGGGELFRTLLELGYVDTVEPAILPVLLGGGRPFLPSPATMKRLRLRGQRVYEKSGTVLLEYEVVGREAGRGARITQESPPSRGRSDYEPMRERQIGT